MRILRFISIVAVMAMILSVSCFAAPVILSQPQNVYLPHNVELPYSVNFSVLAEGENLTYQWQAKDSNGWRDSTVSTATSPNFRVSITELSVNGGREFRCIVSDNDGTTITDAVTVSVGAYILNSIPQMLAFAQTIINNIFIWVSMAAAKIISVPLLLVGVSFFALGASIAILSRLLSRS